MSVDGPKKVVNTTINDHISVTPLIDSKIADVRKSSLTKTTIATSEPIAASRPTETLGDLSLDLDGLVVDALDDKGMHFRIEEYSKIALANPYLKFISLQRRQLSDGFSSKEMAEKLKTMPLNPKVCREVNVYSASLDESSIEIKPEDVKIFTHLMSKIYPQFVRLYNDYFRVNLFVVTKDHKEMVLRDFFTFNGINPYSCGFNLEGNCEKYTYTEIANVLENCSFISDAEKGEFSTALNSAVDFSQMNEEMVDKIKEGKLVVIPVGYLSLEGHHAATIMFYKDEFIICNRGDRILGTPVVQRFNYDKSKVNLDVLKYIIIN